MLSFYSLFGEDAKIIRETNFQVLLLATILPILGTALVSPILSSISQPFGASPSNIGLVISVFTAPSIVMIPIAGGLADRYGRKTILVGSLLLFGLAGTAIAFTTNFETLLVFRFVQGVGFSGINPIIITSIGDMYREETEAAGQGLRFMIAGLSGASFPLVAGGLVIYVWQAPFLLYTIAFPVAVGVYLWFREPTTSESVDGNERGSGQSYIRSLYQLCTRRRVFTIVVARALINTVWIGLLTYNSYIVLELIHGSALEAGILATVVYLGFAGTASQAGRLMSISVDMNSILIGANICLAVGFGVTLLSSGILSALVGTTAVGIGFGILGAIYRSRITGFASSELRGGLVSLSEAGGRLTSTLTPIAMGWAITSVTPVTGFSTALQVTGLSIAIIGGGGGIACVLIASRSPVVSPK